MPKEIRKVKIGMDGIKKDIANDSNLYAFVILTIFLPILIIAIVSIIQLESIGFTLYFMWAEIIIIALYIVLYFSIIHTRIYSFIALKKGNITIKKDKIVDIKEISGRHGVVFYDLIFAQRIPTGKTTKPIIFSTSNRVKLYEWSVNKMDGNWIGKIGDEYYLIFLGKSKKPFMVYNTRYFYIEGDENE